jgi:hypothetical protein
MIGEPGETARTNLNNVAALPVTAGTQTSPANVIVWSVGSDGTFRAQTSGQQLAIAITQQSDGSVQLQPIFSRSGQAAYNDHQSRSGNEFRPYFCDTAEKNRGDHLCPPSIRPTSRSRTSKTWVS